jgi:hypothetical protein
MKIARHQVVELQEARRRPHDIGEVGGIRGEQLQHHGEQVFTPQRLPQPALLRVRGGDVDVPGDQRLGASRIFQAGGQVHMAEAR